MVPSTPPLYSPGPLTNSLQARAPHQPSLEMLSLALCSKIYYDLLIIQSMFMRTYCVVTSRLTFLHLLSCLIWKKQSLQSRPSSHPSFEATESKPWVTRSGLFTQFKKQGPESYQSVCNTHALNPSAYAASCSKPVAQKVEEIFTEYAE